MLDRANLPYIQAAKFTTGGVSPRPVSLIVVHTMECPQSSGAARACGNYFATAAAGEADAN